jgi:cytochrome c biogenesis protein CcmG/thiol:disulfide interchange protein DsbE
VWALVIAAPIVALLAFGFGRDPGAISSPLVQHTAPTFTLRTLNNTWFSLASMRGRPVVLNFWASWCVGCKLEHPYLVDAWRWYHPLGIEFVGVVYEDTASDAKAFLKVRGGGWPNLRDPGQRTAIDFGVFGIPETFFIDRRGIVRYKAIGPVTQELLDAQIQHLLK